MEAKKIGDINNYLIFLENNNDFLRVILIESLKKNNTTTSIFKVIELLMNFEGKSSNNKDIVDCNKTHDRWVAEFFTSVIPCVMFSCYKDKWSNYFKADEERLTNDFKTAYLMTHGEYHKNMNKFATNGGCNE